MSSKVHDMGSEDGLKLPDGLCISSHEVHAWAATLNRSPDIVAYLGTTLLEDETARAARFVRARDRDRFVVARGTLRVLLGAYSNRHPEELRFIYGINGKPDLAPCQDASLTFNVAHSGDLAFYGIARGRRIGVDVEQMRMDFDYTAIARRFFTQQESAALQSLPPAACLRAFYTIWTAKEAFVKAQGERLFTGLEGVIVGCEAGRKPRLLSVPGEAEEVRRWDLRSVDPASDYVGALVVEGREWSLVLHRELL